MSVAGTTPFEDVLAAGGEAVRLAMEEVERELASLTGSYGGRLGQEAGATLAAGGKRLRPLLVFSCGEVGAATADARSALVRAGAAVELVHMATLVHDDVVDGALVRRGQPTVFASSGRGTATASGDFLFSRAFWLLLSNGDREQVRSLADACLSLARGELAQREDAGSLTVDVERYFFRCDLKTASLFTAACRLGALAGGEPAERVAALGRFGRKVGLAFQVLDDVLDVAGPVERTGKERGTDLLEGTTTLPLILAADADPELAHLDLGAVETREDAERICDRIAATDALALSRRRAGELVASAKAELNGDLDPGVRTLLSLVADGVVERYS
jgi:geranylgeranyl pyrophosphate synthase